MDKAIWFWIIYVICVVFSGWSLWPGDRKVWGGSLVLYVLIFLLGLGVFGSPIK